MYSYGYRITVSDSSSNQSFVRSFVWIHLFVRFLLILLSAAAAAAVVAVLMQQKLKAMIKSDKACLPPPLASPSAQSTYRFHLLAHPSIHPSSHANALNSAVHTVRVRIRIKRHLIVLRKVLSQSLLLLLLLLLEYSYCGQLHVIALLRLTFRAVHPFQIAAAAADCSQHAHS